MCIVRAGAVGCFVCGSCAGVAYWVSIYPLDSVKSRVQVLSAQGKVAGLWRTFWNIVTTEGQSVHVGMIILGRIKCTACIIRSTANDDPVVWCVCQSVCNAAALCKNGWTCGLVRVGDVWGPNTYLLDGVSVSVHVAGGGVREILPVVCIRLRALHSMRPSPTYFGLMLLLLTRKWLINTMKCPVAMITLHKPIMI